MQDSPEEVPTNLPPGWLALEDPAWTSTYYVNPSSGAAQWEAPTTEPCVSTTKPKPPTQPTTSASTLRKGEFSDAVAELKMMQLAARNSITDEPGRRGRFSRAWDTMEKDADWLGLVGSRLIDALDDELFRSRYVEGAHEVRPKVVVLGCGWGASAVLSQLKNADADVTVVSPRSYFLFTPMLAGAALGTLEPRSIIQPIREADPHATYFEAEATEIQLQAKTVTCQSVVCEGLDECEIREFDLPYDQLIVAVGASTNTFGVKGVKARDCPTLHIETE